MWTILIKFSCGGSWVLCPGWVTPKTIINKWYKLPLCLAWRHWGRSLVVQLDCMKGWEVCGTVYGNMLYKDLLGSMVRVVYCISVPDSYLVQHGLWCWKSTLIKYFLRTYLYYKESLDTYYKLPIKEAYYNNISRNILLIIILEK